MNNHSLQNTVEEPITLRIERSRTCGTHTHTYEVVPFIARRRHFTGKNIRFRAAAFPPTQVPCNIHAAITLRSATKKSTNAKNHAHMNNIGQPLVAEHRGGTDYAPNRAQPHPPHTRGTFHRRPQPLCKEKHKVLCSGFPPTQAPCNIHAAITMRFPASRR